MKRILAYLLSLSLILLPMPPMAQAEETQVVVASGTIAANVLKASLVDGGATASGGAFADFTALTVNDSLGYVVASGTVTQPNTRIATVATGALLELVGVDLSAHIGRKIVIRSGGKRLEGYIGAAGGESLDTEMCVDPALDNAAVWTTQGTWSVTGGKGVGTTEDNNYKLYITTTVSTIPGALYKRTTDMVVTSGSLVNRLFGLDGVTRTSTGTHSDYFTCPTGMTLANVSTVNPIATFTGIVDNNSTKKVLDLASTGAKIYTTSALSTQSWAYQDTGYDPNAAAGVTYEIYSVTPLTNHIGHLLRVKSLTSGQVLQGDIKAAGTGETVGAERIVSWTNRAGQAYDTLIINGNGHDVDSAVNLAADIATAYTNNSAAGGELQKIVLDITLNSGTAPTLHPTIDSSGSVGAGIGAVSDGTVYYTGATGIYGFAIRQASTATNFSLLVSQKQVLTPSATGATIVSTKGGATYNWAAKPTTLSTFLNDAAGYTYEIVKVLDAPVIATQAISAGAALIDSTTANAFYGGADLDCTNYQDGRHLAHFTDSSGQVAVAWISGTAPSGEALGDELITSWTNNAGSYPFETFTTSGINITSAINSSGLGYASTPSLGNLSGQLLKLVANTTLTGGSLRLHVPISETGASPNNLDTGVIDSTRIETKYGTVDSALARYVNISTSNTSTNGSMIPSVKRVTMPAATGALLLSAKGGDRGWMLKSATWDPNKAQTLRILYAGD